MNQLGFFLILAAAWLRVNTKTPCTDGLKLSEASSQDCQDWAEDIEEETVQFRYRAWCARSLQDKCGAELKFSDSGSGQVTVVVTWGHDYYLASDRENFEGILTIPESSLPPSTGETYGHQSNPKTTYTLPSSTSGWEDDDSFRTDSASAWERDDPYAYETASTPKYYYSQDSTSLAEDLAKFLADDARKQNQGATYSKPTSVQYSSPSLPPEQEPDEPTAMDELNKFSAAAAADENQDTKLSQNPSGQYSSQPSYEDQPSLAEALKKFKDDDSHTPQGTGYTPPNIQSSPTSHDEKFRLPTAED